MNRHEVIIATRWVKDASGRNEPVLIALPPGSAWEDATGQPAAVLPPSPNIYLVRAFLDDAGWAAVNADTRFSVLARRTWDDGVFPRVYTVNNFDDKPTATQLNALKNQIIARFPGVDVEALTEAGQAIFRAGLSRIEVIGLLVARWRRFVKG